MTNPQHANTAPADHPAVDPADHGSVGVVGLGNMGLALATRLRASVEVFGHDLSAERVDAAGERGIRTGELAELAAACETVVLSLPAPAASRQVATTLAAAGGAVRWVVETSTVTPDDVRAVTEILGPDIAVVDAAILSGVAAMESGNAGLLISGSDDAVQAVDPLLQAITSKRQYVGTSGAAMATKVVNNAVAHTVMVLLLEAVALADAAKVDLDTLVAVLSSEDGGLVRPLTHRVAERVRASDYGGGMPLEAARKDSVLALSLGQSLGVPLFTIPASHTAYEIAMTRGDWDREDYAVIARLWEEWGKTSFSRPEPAGLSAV